MTFRSCRGPGWLLVAVALTLAWIPFTEAPAGQQKTDRLWVYVGTYTQKASKGIYRFELDPASGKLTSRALAAEVKNPSFLAIDPEQRFLYAVNEVGDFDNKKTGAV